MQELLQALTVELPSGWKLIQNRTEMATESAHPTEQSIERLFWILQLFHVRQEPAGFHGIQKSTRRAVGPPGESRALRQSIESIVDFNRVKNLCVVIEPFRTWD